MNDKIYKDYLKTIVESGILKDLGTEPVNLAGSDSYVYRYERQGGGTSSDSNSRSFCKAISRTKLFTLEEIDKMTNAGQGPGGSSNYDIFKYRGGLNCKDFWQRYEYSVKDKEFIKDPKWNSNNSDQPFPVPAYSTKLNEQIMEENIKGDVYFLELDLFDMESGIHTISFVDKPAVQETWVTLSEEDVLVTDNKKQIIRSAVMVPNKPIKRKIGDYTYYIKFSESTIEDMRKNFAMKGNPSNVNLQHQENINLSGVHLMDNYIVTDDMNSDYPVGSWVLSYFIENKQLFNELVENPNFNGFSLEGNFDHVLSDEKLVLSILEDESLDDDEKYGQIKNILSL